MLQNKWAKEKKKKKKIPPTLFDLKNILWDIPTPGLSW